MKNQTKYQISPQIKFYDSMSALWRPFTMFGHYPNIRSKYCNTDIFGFRFNELKKKKINSIFEQYINSKKEKAVIVGNSMSFGEGLTSDTKTISNYLTKNSKYDIYNLSVRGFSGLQEIINFLIHFNKIKNLKRILIISGLNDSFLPYFIKDIDNELTPFFGFERFKKKMLSDSLGWKNKIFSFFFKYFLSNKEELNQLNSLNWKEIILKKIKFKSNKNIFLSRDECLKRIIERNLLIWKAISVGMNVKLDYILQPVATWCKPEKNQKESKIIEFENKKKTYKKIIKHIDIKKYNLLKKIISSVAKKNKINFYDLNDFFNNKKFKNKTLFNGYFHTSNEGSHLISQYINKHILK